MKLTGQYRFDRPVYVQSEVGILAQPLRFSRHR
jgi:hypothetical protein